MTFSAYPVEQGTDFSWQVVKADHVDSKRTDQAHVQKFMRMQSKIRGNYLI